MLSLCKRLSDIEHALLIDNWCDLPTDINSRAQNKLVGNSDHGQYNFSFADQMRQLYTQTADQKVGFF